MEDTNLQIETAQLLPNNGAGNHLPTKTRLRHYYGTHSSKEAVLHIFRIKGVATSMADFQRVLVVGGSLA